MRQSGVFETDKLPQVSVKQTIMRQADAGDHAIGGFLV